MVPRPAATIGSPPRTRGLLTASISASWRCSVHPRAHGDYGITYSFAAYVAGSPPRTRGLRYSNERILVFERFTPAHTGITMAAESSVTPSPGSPPRTQGLLRLVLPVHQDPRFTPAHAGITRRRSRPSCTASVHPRARGDYWSVVHSYDPPNGSPPRTRGLLTDLALFRDSLRFTPAHTGITRRSHPAPPRRSVHPRAHGDYI